MVRATHRAMASRSWQPPCAPGSQNFRTFSIAQPRSEEESDIFRSPSRRARGPCSRRRTELNSDYPVIVPAAVEKKTKQIIQPPSGSVTITSRDSNYSKMSCGYAFLTAFIFALGNLLSIFQLRGITVKSHIFRIL